MLKFFTARQLSSRLNVSLAKWKRWSREFLAPDPLGGLQSGYARQYKPDEAFRVHLGGYLVAEMKFSIPEAKQILGDLQGWLAMSGFCFDTRAGSGNDDLPPAGKEHVISIGLRPRQGGSAPEFCYQARGIVSRRSVEYRGSPAMQVLYVENRIGPPGTAGETSDLISFRALRLGRFLETFVQRLDLDRAHYAALQAQQRNHSESLR